MKRFKLSRNIAIMLSLFLLIVTMVPNASFAVGQKHKIEGVFWYDANANGIRDVDEIPISGETILINGSNGCVTNTDSNGRYTCQVYDGVYYVQFGTELDEGTFHTKQDIGYDDRVDSDGSYVKVVVNGNDVSHVDFGITDKPYTVRITDKVKVKDDNGNIIGYLYKNDKTKVYSVYNGGELYLIKYNGEDRLLDKKCTDYHLTNIPNYDVKTTASVNVRSSVWGNVIGSLPANKVKTVYGQRKDSNGKTWYRVWYNGGPAYIYANLTKKHYNFYTRLTDKTRVRTSPSGSTVGYLYKNDIKTVYGITTDCNGRKWYKVWYDNTIRYIYSNCTNDNLWPAINFNVKVTANALNIRDSVWGNVIGTLSYGQVKTVYGQRKDSDGKTWYRVWHNGGPAYIISDFTKLH